MPTAPYHNIPPEVWDDALDIRRQHAELATVIAELDHTANGQGLHGAVEQLRMFVRTTMRNEMVLYPPFGPTPTANDRPILLASWAHNGGPSQDWVDHGCSPGDLQVAWAERPEDLYNLKRRKKTRFTRFARKAGLSEAEVHGVFELLVGQFGRPEHKVIRGQEILDFLGSIPYNSPPLGSCMTGSSAIYMRLWAENPDKVGMMITSIGGQPVSRGLIITCDCGTTVMDRRYPESGRTEAPDKAWAKANGYAVRTWNGYPDRGRTIGFEHPDNPDNPDGAYVVTLKAKASQRMPYFDSFGNIEIVDSDTIRCRNHEHHATDCWGAAQDWRLDPGHTLTACDGCGEDFHDDEIQTLDVAGHGDLSMCEDCRADLAVCDNCHSMMHESDSTHVHTHSHWGENWCEDCCATHLTFECEDCGYTFPESRGPYTGDDMVTRCGECHRTHVEAEAEQTPAD